MAAARHLVVVARADPATTDALADVLRETCAVRTAYSRADVLDRLDEEVDVVLLDPDVETGAVSVVGEALADRGLPCQFGLLAEDSDADADGVHAVVSPSAEDEALRETVEWLATRAAYCRALDEYYDVALAVAESEETDDLAAERRRLSGRLDRLQSDLDEAAADLDAVSLFEAALGRSRGE